MIRALFIAVFFFTMTPLLISIQWLLGKLGLPGWGFICSNYYRVLCSLLRIRVRVNGAPVRDRAVLYRLQSRVLGRHRGDRFARAGRLRRQEAKCAAGRWSASPPRCSARCSSTATAAIRPPTRSARWSTRLKGGTSVVLFAEGTSSDGNRVLPFRSALLGAVKHVAAHSDAAGDILIQPMSISYISTHGIPLGRQHRPLVAWYGDLDFMPHIKAFIARGAVDAVVSYGEPVKVDAATDRKALTRRLEGTVRALMAAALLKRPLPVPAFGPGAQTAPETSATPLQQAPAS